MNTMSNSLHFKKYTDSAAFYDIILDIWNDQCQEIADLVLVVFRISERKSL